MIQLETSRKWCNLHVCNHCRFGVYEWKYKSVFKNNAIWNKISLNAMPVGWIYFLHCQGKHIFDTLQRKPAFSFIKLRILLWLCHNNVIFSTLDVLLMIYRSECTELRYCNRRIFRNLQFCLFYSEGLNTRNTRRVPVF